MKLPIDLDVSDEDEHDEGPGIDSRYQARYENRQLSLRKEYRTLTPHVGVPDLPAYDETIDRIENNQAYSVVEGGPAGVYRSGSGSLWVIPLGLTAFAGAFLFTVNLPRMWRGLRARRRKRRFARSLARTGGETPGTALRAGSLQAIDEHMTALICSCEQRPALQLQRTPASVRYMGQQLWHQAAQCPACGARVTRYFALEGE